MSGAITDLLHELGLNYQLIDDEAFVSCPFHQPDRHPSFSVNTRTGVYYCFSCGARGNLSNLVSHIRGITYTNATIYVNQRIGWARAHKWREDYEHKNFAPDYLRISEADMALFTEPPVDKLLSKRITAEKARLYEVKWNPERGTWIFPYRDPYTKQLWGWQEKNDRIFRNFPAGTRKSKTLFGLSIAGDGSSLILTESPVDAVRIASAGFSGGISSFGVSVSDYQLTLVQRLSDDLVLALDNDTAGISGTAGVINKWAGKIQNIRIYNYGTSKAKDPGEQSDEEVAYGLMQSVPALKWIKDYNRRH
jgi:DNA primase